MVSEMLMKVGIVMAAAVAAVSGVATSYVVTGQSRSPDPSTTASNRDDGENRDDLQQAPATLPFGAVPLSVSQSQFGRSFKTTVIASAGCAGLEAVIDVDGCVEFGDDVGGSPARVMTLTSSGSGLSVVVYRFESDSNQITARRIMRATYPHAPLEPGARHDLEVLTSSDLSSVAGVLHRSSGPDDTRTAVLELIDLSGDTDAGVRGTFSGADLSAAVSDEGLFVVANRYGAQDAPCCPSDAMLHTVFISSGEWMGISELLDESEIVGRVGQSAEMDTISIGHAAPPPPPPPPPATTTTTTIPPPMTITPSPAESPQVGVDVPAGNDPLSQLLGLASRDRPAAQELLQWWVPQVSAKWVGLEIDGFTFGLDEILDDHLRQRSAYGAILVQSGEYRMSDNPSLWVSLVPVRSADAQGALDWCRSMGIGREDCFARLVTRDMSLPLTETRVFQS